MLSCCRVVGAVGLGSILTGVAWAEDPADALRSAAASLSPCEVVDRGPEELGRFGNGREVARTRYTYDAQGRTTLAVVRRPKSPTERIAFTYATDRAWCPGYVNELPYLDHKPLGCLVEFVRSSAHRADCVAPYCTHPPGTEWVVNDTTSFSHPRPASLVVAASHSAQATLYVIDSRGRVSVDDRGATYAYDASGRRSEVRFAFDYPKNGTTVAQYTYDSRSRVTQVDHYTKDAQGATTRHEQDVYRYTDQGRLDTITSTTMQSNYGDGIDRVLTYAYSCPEP